MNLESDDECTADVGAFGEQGCHRYPECGCGVPRDLSQEFLDTPFYRSECLLNKWYCVTFNEIVPDIGGYVFYYRGYPYKMKPNHGVPYKIKESAFPREVVFLSESVYGKKMSDIFVRKSF